MYGCEAMTSSRVPGTRPRRPISGNVTSREIIELITTGRSGDHGLPLAVSQESA